MLKMIIADDERIIRQGLKGALNWQDLNIEVVGEAEDGEEALALTRELRPDIALVDICMPFLNGLDMIERIIEELPHIHIVIISGHDEFEYAKRAVRLKVKDYLLKPVEEEELLEVMSKIVKQIDLERVNLNNNRIKGRAVEQNKKTIRTQYIRDMIFSKIKIDENDLSYFGLKYVGEFGLLLVKPAQNRNVYEKNYNFDKELLYFSVQNIIEELLVENEQEKGYVARVDENYIVVLFESEEIETIEDLSKSIDLKVKHLLHSECYQKGTLVKTGMANVGTVYEKLRMAVDEDFAYTPIVARVKRFIDTNYHYSDLSLEEVADFVQMNSTYLSRLLKTELGNTFVDYLTKVRIDKSKELLISGQYKIYEIAEKVGYKSQHYFSKAFKKVIDVSPKQFQQQTHKR